MLEGMRVGFAVTGSFCTHRASLQAMETLVKKGVDVYPILSYNSSEMSTRFMSNTELLERLVLLSGHEPICTIRDAEPIGPKKLFDAVAIVPCTGNTLAKLANSITDTPVLMAAKSHMRNNRPLVLAVSTNDGLAGSAKNIGLLLSMKNYYFVPFGQDDCMRKPFSLVADFDLLGETLVAAMEGRQLQPVLLSGK